MAAATVKRDIIVVGTSAGGVEALPHLLRPLPQDLPAAVLIVQHQAPSRDPQLVNILKRNADIEVRWAEQGERFRSGCVYLAPPDVHLSFSNDHLALTGGPRENYARPSIDRLFRSAAALHSSRTIAVLLTGMMDDGVAGALAILEGGGRVIVQDPRDAAFPELPTRALAAFTPDFTLPLDRIPSALLELAGEEVVVRRPPADVMFEHSLDMKPGSLPTDLDQLGPRSPTRCPECGGTLWSIGRPQTPRWRCYLGHIATPRELLLRSSEEVEMTLWSGVRALYEHAITLDSLAESARSSGSIIADEYEQRARETRHQAELARSFVVDLVSRSR
jgi:two-component system chemotaxis response regulator CheB